jgi:hypothetical protein
MATLKTNPTLDEMKQVVANAGDCLTCNVTECGTSQNPCFEFTPEGVQVCAQLPWWKGRPVPRDTLIEWSELIRQLEGANRGD